jgi:hypothetical protein
MVERAGRPAKLGIKVHAHMLRHACGYAVANAGHDTRAAGVSRPEHNALHRAGAGSICEVLAGLGRRPGFYVMPYYGGHRSAPRVIAVLAGFVHDRQSAADYEYNHDKNA